MVLLPAPRRRPRVLGAGRRRRAGAGLLRHRAAGSRRRGAVLPAQYRDPVHGARRRRRQPPADHRPGAALHALRAPSSGR
ncbi:MAG: hypothetical protein U5K43_03215 [Halofilum sp. (in: g-proteobacteria)]|nr:hypothetical protein [Halofilum sp. (in: g-proteobacteria)]